MAYPCNLYAELNITIWHTPQIRSRTETQLRSKLWLIRTHQRAIWEFLRRRATKEGPVSDSDHRSPSRGSASLLSSNRNRESSPYSSLLQPKRGGELSRSSVVCGGANLSSCCEEQLIPWSWWWEVGSSETGREEDAKEKEEETEMHKQQRQLPQQQIQKKRKTQKGGICWWLRENCKW